MTEQAPSNHLERWSDKDYLNLESLYLEGWSPEDIAEIMGRTELSIRTRISQVFGETGSRPGQTRNIETKNVMPKPTGKKRGRPRKKPEPELQVNMNGEIRQAVSSSLQGEQLANELFARAKDMGLIHTHDDIFRGLMSHKEYTRAGKFLDLLADHANNYVNTSDVLDKSQLKHEIDNFVGAMYRLDEYNRITMDDINYHMDLLRRLLQF